MPEPILYLGDTHLNDAAAYLAGLMHHWGWPFDYVPSDRPADAELFRPPRHLIILSDYPAALMDDPCQQRLVDLVAAGAGLLMCGGWESYHGLGGNWDGTIVAEILPVEILDEDDRLNCDQPLLLYPAAEHPIVDHLPWQSRSPLIGGFNRITPRPASNVLLESHRFSVTRSEGRFEFEHEQAAPLLVVGSHEGGRTAALATDVAPHWVGPLVDWGLPRVSAQAPGAGAVEVGGYYAQFLRQLLSWTAGADRLP